VTTDPYGRLAAVLVADLSDSRLKELATRPLGTIRTLGVRVAQIVVATSSESCSCDGVYVRASAGRPPAIGYVPTPQSRRENFTLLHELGHHLTRTNDQVLSAVHDLSDDHGRSAEDRVCDSFAAQILLPDSLVERAVGTAMPRAAHLVALVGASKASRPACAVRLAERLPSDGYVLIADTRSRTVSFASPSPSWPYLVRKGSAMDASHPIWKAVADGAARGQGPIRWPGGSKNLWFDAVLDEPYVYAVFSESRYWPSSELGILAEPTRLARPVPLQGTCKHCGSDTWGYRACDKCGDVRCNSCGKCGCGARQVAERMCRSCFMVKGEAQFAAGADVCIDCR
jgi:hypothetical protein